MKNLCINCLEIAKLYTEVRGPFKVKLSYPICISCLDHLTNTQCSKSEALNRASRAKELLKDFLKMKKPMGGK